MINTWSDRPAGCSDFIISTIYRPTECIMFHKDAHACLYVCMYAYLLCTLVFAIIFESKVKLENKSEILLYVMRPKKANLYFSKFLKPDVEIINQNQSNVSNK